MEFRKSLIDFTEIYENLYDDESIIIFELRIKYSLGLISWEKMCQEIFKLNYKRKWHNLNLVDYFDSYEAAKNEKFIIFGIGVRGKITHMLLNELKFDIAGFSDNNFNDGNRRLFDKDLILPYEILQKYPACYIIVSVLDAESQALIFKQLVMYGINPKKILLLRAGAAWADVGDTYFDFPEISRKANEVFIDAGCYDGKTSIDFIEWCKGDYKQIYAFEPDEKNFNLCERKLDKIDKISIYNYGLWNENEKVSFCNDANDSSKISLNGNIVIEGRKLDDFAYDFPITYIKMDIEGAELEALQGAKKVIEKYRPRLAICVYHNKKDLINIVLYLYRLDVDYHFALRAYNSLGGDVVLYAW